MVDIFISDSRNKYTQSHWPHKILYLDGFIGECSFIDPAILEDFNSTLVGLDDEASRLMLEQFDADARDIINHGYKFKANKYISALPDIEKIHSTLFHFHKFFVLKKYLFRLVFDRFFDRFRVIEPSLHLALSEYYILTRDLPYQIASASYDEAFKHSFFKAFLRQAYYFSQRLLPGKKAEKAHIVIFLFDIHNEFDLFKTFIQVLKLQTDLAVRIVVVDSGNPADKKVDAAKYAGGNIKISYLYEEKALLLANYNDFYSICEKLNPLYSIFRKARWCEQEDVQYAFVANVLKKFSPAVCLYVNVQEFGRVVTNVSRKLGITSFCVDYSFFFDTYNMEKRIKFDLRACISQITVANWIKHKDPTTIHEVIGFCKLDDWHEKLATIKSAASPKLFDNDRRTILFASTWAPNPNSPLLKEKMIIVEQLSEICYRNNWNLLIKKHPSEFDKLVDTVFNTNKYSNQKYFEHDEMSLFDCVYHADFICTQNSSVFVEALFLGKPFSYLTINGENIWANLSYFSKESDVGTFGSVSEYGEYIRRYQEEQAYRILQEKFVLLQIKYLYKTDGKASERLLQLVRSYIKQT